MATATPEPSPNPNALKFNLDRQLPETWNFDSPAAAEGNPFAAAVLATEGVVSIFGVNDFITVTRSPGADWDPIIAAVQSAAVEHL